MISNKIFSERRSIVCFDTSVVPNEILTALFDAARWAPSANNQQPWRFFLGIKGSQTYNTIFESLNQGNKIWTINAPVLIATVAETYNLKRETENKYAWHDSALALSNLIMQATMLGLFVHPMAGFSSTYLAKFFNIPKEFEAVTTAAIGYSGDCKDLPAELAARNGAERKRKSLQEIVYSEKWNEPFSF